MSATAEARSTRQGTRAATRGPGRLTDRRADLLLGAGVAAGLCAIAFGAQGGTTLSSVTWAEIAAVLAATALTIAALLRGGDTGRVWGAWTLVALAALAALCALSILWAVEPSDAWLEANLTFAYMATFAAAIALVRIAPRRWRGTVLGVLAAALIVSAEALVAKVFPAAFTPEDAFARLREPFGYWNAVGLMAALGVPGCLWLGTRPTGRDRWSAVAYPALGLLVVVVLLSYSRGGLLALVIGAGLWVAVVPRRLRALALLATSGGAAALLAAWAFSRHALSADHVPLTARDNAGHDLGWIVLAMLVMLAAAGLTVELLRERRPLGAEARRRAGVAAAVALALVPVAGAVVLAASDRGLSGSISHAADRLTDPDAHVPGNQPGRLTAVGSVRAQYWDEALRVFADHPWRGSGADGYATARARYAKGTLEVRHAHGYVVQTLADLGLIGLAISLAALAAWLVAAARATGLGRRSPRPRWSGERIGLVSLCATVVVFGVSSFVDWTWSVPAVAMTALLCAGWVAGRGPLEVPAGADEPERRDRSRTERRVLAGCALIAGLALAWAIWQPLRSQDASDAALAALERGDAARAVADIHTARDRNPLSIDPLLDLSAIEQSRGDLSAALAAVRAAVALQPANPETWRSLGEFELDVMGDPRAARAPLAASLYLDPHSREGLAAYSAARARAGG